jgi:hypothetical protein
MIDDDDKAERLREVAKFKADELEAYGPSVCLAIALELLARLPPAMKRAALAAIGNEGEKGWDVS